MKHLIFLSSVILLLSLNDNYKDQFSISEPLLKGLKADGAVKGKITLPKKSLRKVLRKRRSRRYGRNVMRMAKRAKKFTEYEKSMVYLVPLNSKNNVKKLVPQILSQKDVSFQPAHVVVQKGANVNMLNRDNIFHNVFSNDQNQEFNIGKVRKNVDKVVTFESTGHIQVFCDIHAFMNAIISIVDTPYFTKANADGSFEIRDVPEGRYKLIGWHGRSEYKATLIDVKAGRFTVINQMRFN
jgi:plastocyanin